MKIPQMAIAEIQSYIDASGIKDKVCIVGVRGYYKDSYGKPGVNDRGFYDDAIFIVAPNAFASFQANVDPSVFRKGIATLKVGVYKCVKWFHRGKVVHCEALQIVKDEVNRDGETGTDTGRHGINFHYGSETQTWSEGCQTLPQSTFRTFIKTVYSLMDSYDLSEITYLLIDNK